MNSRFAPSRAPLGTRCRREVAYLPVVSCRQAFFFARRRSLTHLRGHRQLCWPLHGPIVLVGVWPARPLLGWSKAWEDDPLMVLAPGTRPERAAGGKRVIGLAQEHHLLVETPVVEDVAHDEHIDRGQRVL